MEDSEYVVTLYWEPPPGALQIVHRETGLFEVESVAGGILNARECALARLKERVNELDDAPKRNKRENTELTLTLVCVAAIWIAFFLAFRSIGL